MKPFIVVTLCSMLSAPMLFSQSGSINNTLGASGIFTIKDGSTTFLTLSQSDGSLSLNNILIFKGADRFIHDFKAPSTDGNNTFVGVNSGNFTMAFSAFSAQASYNTAVGHSSLTSLTSGFNNSAFGYQSLFDNTTGSDNSAFGKESLYSNTTGAFNSAFGLQSLGSNTEGADNSAFGYLSLGSNTIGGANSAFGVRSLYSNTGSSNSAFGYQSLYNTTGSDNSAFGNGSLYSNTTGNYNSAFGNGSLYNTTGSDNSAFGWFAGNSITTGSNNIAIGYGAQVAVGTVSNQIRIGDTRITLATTQIAWTTSSDRRWKSNIAQSDLGLDFVSKLNPVSYTRKNDEKQRTEYGFIAQEIEEVLKRAGAENTGMLTIDDAGMYQLRYNDLLAPMVKAIQELKAENDALRNEVVNLRGSISEQVKNEVKKVLLKAIQTEETAVKVSLNEN